MTKDEWYDNLTVNDTLIMKAPSPNQGYEIDIKTVWVTFPTEGPLLRITQGIWGMKDFSCIGFLGSVSKTVVTFGATYTNCVPSDIGKVVKDDGVDTSILAHYNNAEKEWWLAGASSIANGSAMTIVNGTGAGTSSGNSSTGGGGAILMGHGLNGASAPPQLSLVDSASGYDTLHLVKVDGTTPSHLDLGDLTAHGTLYADAFVTLTGVNLDFQGHIIPRYTDQYHLGNEDNYFSEIWGTTLYADAFVTRSSATLDFQGHIVPRYNGTYYLGTGQKYWSYVICDTLYAKHSSSFGCAKELSDTLVEPTFKSVEEAESFLQHEMTKELRHLKYNDAGDKIVCTCGKEVDVPCPEHKKEWEERYTLNTGDLIEAQGIILMQLLDRVSALEEA